MGPNESIYQCDKMGIFTSVTKMGIFTSVIKWEYLQLSGTKWEKDYILCTCRCQVMSPIIASACMEAQIGNYR